MNFWSEHLTIGNRTFPRFMGGPLDRITDSPFRKLVRQFSTQELLYTEMRHVACIANDRTGRLSLDFDQVERPLNYQIAACSTDFIDRALDRVVACGVDMIDLNVGCPARAVTGNGAGSALMADVPRLQKIVSHIRSRVSIPFTIKIRAGFKTVNAIEVARMAQDCGVDALAIHPRTQKQRFSGRPDYALVAQVKKALNIPVLLSGNVINFKTAALAHEQTGVDGFLVGRGIWSQPWKLAQMRAHAAGTEFIVDRALVLRCALQHFDRMLEHYGPHGLYLFRKHVALYVRGVIDASSIRSALVRAESIDKVKDGLMTALGE